MTSVAVLAKIPAQPGKRDQLVEALRGAFPHVEGEPGTRFYILHEDSSDEDAVWFYELYADESAFEAHRSAGWMKEFGMSVREFAAGRPELTLLRPVGGKGL
jgi:(4S)-4-hydroxy-5-phosphonooxypentane-2,3-dione isomerase